MYSGRLCSRSVYTGAYGVELKQDILNIRDNLFSVGHLVS